MKDFHKLVLTNFWVLLLFAILLYSCHPGKIESDSLVFEQKSFEKEACIENECAGVKLSYPFFMGDDETASVLNTHVEQQLVMFLNVGERQEVVPLDFAVSAFLESYIAFKKDFDSPQEWEISVDSKVTYQGQKLISIVFDSFSFTGGAHPNSYRMYLNFDLSDNSILKNEELILDEKALLLLAEAKFRDYHEVPQNVSLEEDGSFFLENDTDFFLPAAMGFEGEEFVMLYNPYEIGPYVMGLTVLRFTKEEIKGKVILP